MPKFKSMEDIIAAHKGTVSYEDLLSKSIPHIQKILRERNEDEKITVKEMKLIYDEEQKRKKPRKSLSRWIQECISRDDIIGEFYLDFMSTVGIFKSALQKYIRRGDPVKAVQSAKALQMMQSSSLNRRLKVIIPEDVFTGITLYQHVDEFPLEVTYSLAALVKDGHCCRAFNEIKATNKYKDGCDIEWLKANWETGDIYKVVSMLFALCEDKRMDTVEEVFAKKLKGEPAVQAIIDELKSDSKVDYHLTVVSVLRMLRTGYDRTVEIYPEPDLDVEPIEISELDWYVFDMHTFPGRVARDLIAKDKGLSPGEVGWAWWFGEASIRKDEVRSTSVFGEFVLGNEIKYKKMWGHLRELAIEKVMYSVTELFKLNIKEPD